METCNFLQCKKKTMLGCPKCKCGNAFCSKHRQAEDHMCSFDFKKEYASKLSAENPRVVDDKLDARI
jgi:predicted nucleic acid binding AN1-type Zn finger protein